MMAALACAAHLVHNLYVRETSRVRFSSRNLQAGRTANIGGIFSSQAIAPSMGGVAGGGNPCRVPVAGLLTRHCRPPRLAAWSGQPLLQEASTMAKSLRAPAQSIPFPAPVYHAAVAAGIEAAHAWFADPVLTAGEHKHDARVAYVDNVINMNEPGRIPLAAAVNGFGDGFDQGIAQIIAGGVSHA